MLREEGCGLERLDLRTSSEPPFGPSLSAVRPVEKTCRRAQVESLKAELLSAEGSQWMGWGRFEVLKARSACRDIFLAKPDQRSSVG
jgi:hypothetical protein